MDADEALDLVRSALHASGDRNTVTDLRPALDTLGVVLRRALQVRDGWFVATPVNPEEVARFILTGETEA